jgi:hypothetical protein
VSTSARQASPRVLAIAATILALAAAVVVVGAALSRGQSKDTTVPARGSLTNAVPGSAKTQRLFKGIPQSGNVLGKSTAPVTVYEYVDAQCPFCEQFETQAMPSLIERYVRTGKAKVVLRPIAFIGADSERGRVAMIAGAEQNKMFNVAQLLFLNQGAENSGWLDDDLVEGVGASIPASTYPVSSKTARHHPSPTGPARTTPKPAPTESRQPRRSSSARPARAPSSSHHADRRPTSSTRHRRRAGRIERRALAGCWVSSLARTTASRT